METQVINPTAVPQKFRCPCSWSRPTNPRQHFEENDLKELAETIRKSRASFSHSCPPQGRTAWRSSSERGVIVPHRWPGRKPFPSLVREMTDAEVLEAQLVENLQRRDVHPMEEAEGYKRLLDLEEPKYTVEQIAAKVGKAPAYIATRSETDRPVR